MARMQRLQGDMVVSRVFGVPNSLKRLKQFRGELEIGCEKGMKKALEWVREKVREVTPIKTGLLRESIQISTRGKGFNIEGILYCDDSTDYAIYVHEDLTKFHAPPTGAKFMQRTVWQNRAQFSSMIVQEAKRNISYTSGGRASLTRDAAGTLSGITNKVANVVKDVLEE
jgi:hypothetical protein